MKKTLFILLFITNLSTAQTEEVTYKVGYNPNTNYEMTMIQVSKNQIKYFGSDDFINKLSEQGISNPIYSVDSTYTNTLLKTGSLVEDSFSVVMETIEEFRSDGRHTLPVNTKIYGTAKPGNFPVMDSINSSEMSESKKQTFLQIINSTMSQISVTPRKISTGSTFIERDTIQIPINNFNLNILSLSKYTVNNIADGKVFMSIEIDINLLFDSEIPFKAEAAGIGSGNIVYDISNTFIEEYELASNMTISIEIENILMEVNTESLYEQKNKFFNL
jgi:hypothetical protein